MIAWVHENDMQISKRTICKSETQIEDWGRVTIQTRHELYRLIMINAER